MLVKYDLDAKGTGHVFERKSLIAQEESKYQTIEISDLEILGRVLVLDNIIQLSSLDCDRYHETFAHVPMSCIPNPKRALILGGGDGILAKELLKYKNMIVDMVDIDERVCELSKIHLLDMNAGAFDSDMLNLFYEDALSFCKRSEHKYDVIYGDITDPHPDSPSSSLLGAEAIEIYKGLLAEGGILAIQTDNVQIAPEHLENVKATLSDHFYMSGDFSIVALTLSSIFSFVWASDATRVVPKSPVVETNWLNRIRSEFCFNVRHLALGEK